MIKLDEIKWRLANRTVAYLLPGQPPDTTAHDDMTMLLEFVDMLALETLDDNAKRLELVTAMTSQIERRYNLLDGILSM